MAHGRQLSSLSVAMGSRRRCSSASHAAAIGRLSTSRAAAHVGGSIGVMAIRAEPKHPMARTVKNS